MYLLAHKLGIAKRDVHVYARFISRWKYRFSSDQRSQATLSSVSTDVGDQSGTQSDLAFLFLAVLTPLSPTTDFNPDSSHVFFAAEQTAHFACVRCSTHRAGRRTNSQIRVTSPLALNHHLSSNALARVSPNA